MKNSKKLTILGLSAATALVAATGAVSSFAWFAANGSVTADGMNVKALSTTAYLQIKNSTATWSTSENQVAASAVTGEATLNPTHIFKSLKVNSGATADETTPYDKGSTVVWASANSNKVTESTKDGHYTNVTQTAAPAETQNGATTYTLINTFNLRLRPNVGTDSQATAGALTASVAFANKSSDEIRKAVSVFVTIDTKGMLFTNDGTTFTATGDKQLVDQMTTTEVSAKIYVFFDGENAACFTNNVNVNSAYSVKVTFSLVA